MQRTDSAEWPLDLGVGVMAAIEMVETVRPLACIWNGSRRTAAAAMCALSLLARWIDEAELVEAELRGGGGA